MAETSETCLVGLARRRRGKVYLLPAAVFLRGKGIFPNGTIRRSLLLPEAEQGGARLEHFTPGQAGLLLWKVGGSSCGQQAASVSREGRQFSKAGDTCFLAPAFFLSPPLSSWLVQTLDWMKIS